jgi:hypothetical protein
MDTVVIDRELAVRQLEAKRDSLTSPRQRRMLDVYLEHLVAEIEGDVDRVMATVAPEPRYHVWVAPGDSGPKGFAAVRDMYADMYSAKSHYFEMDFPLLVVDDDTIVAELLQRKIVPGTALLGGPWAGSMADVDPDRHYLVTGRSLVIVPFDEECRVVGEDAYSGGASTSRVLDDAEIPDDYREFLEA